MTTLTPIRQGAPLGSDCCFMIINAKNDKIITIFKIRVWFGVDVDISKKTKKYKRFLKRKMTENEK